MALYPANLIREHRLADSRTVTIRPIRPDDGGREKDFLTALSGESRYLRFQRWVAAPSNDLIHFLTDVDYERHLALVCAVRRDQDEELVGEARYVANPDGKSCEFSIVIADSWQKTGIAGILMDDLMRAARERGLTLMEGLVLSSNVSMLRFAHALGFEVTPIPEDLTTMRIVKRLGGGPQRE
jgi:acetyltransferase